MSNNALVTDFINVGIGPIRSGVFNVADMAIMFGGMAIGFLTLKREADEHSGLAATVKTYTMFSVTVTN